MLGKLRDFVSTWSAEFENHTSGICSNCNKYILPKAFFCRAWYRYMWFLDLVSTSLIECQYNPGKIPNQGICALFANSCHIFTNTNLEPMEAGGWEHVYWIHAPQISEKKSNCENGSNYDFYWPISGLFIEWIRDHTLWLLFLLLKRWIYRMVLNKRDWRKMYREISKDEEDETRPSKAQCLNIFCGWQKEDLGAVGKTCRNWFNRLRFLLIISVHRLCWSSDTSKLIYVNAKFSLFSLCTPNSGRTEEVYKWKMGRRVVVWRGGGLWTSATDTT